MQQLSFFNTEPSNEPVVKTSSVVENISVEGNGFRRYKRDVVHSLTTLPVGDGNWGSAAKSATNEELNKALKILTELNEKEKGHKSRLLGVQREINKRKRK